MPSKNLRDLQFRPVEEQLRELVEEELRADLRRAWDKFFDEKANRPPVLFWCNTHQRRALCLEDCYQGTHYKGGITLACKIVDLTGLCEIVEDSAAPWTPKR